MRYLILLLFIIGCTKEVSKPLAPAGQYTVKTGNHKFSPYESGFTSGNEWTFDVLCTPLSSYFLPYPDSEDWNKMTGISWSLFSNTKRSTMLAYRDRPSNQTTEYSFYSHTQNGVIKDRAILKVSYDIVVRYRIKELVGDYISLRLENTQTGEHIEDVVHITGKGITKRYVGTYFGGTSPAPNNITVFVFKL